MRDNSAKPSLSYVFCNALALERLEEYAPEHVWGTESVLEPLRSIAGYLARETDDLGVAAFEIVELLQQDLAPATCPLGVSGFVGLLLHEEAWDAYCAVCVRGAEKYARGNYRKGAPVTQYLDSACRHLMKRLTGERIDSETGCQHLAHALWNVFQALDQPAWRDDRLEAVARDPAHQSTVQVRIDGTLVQGWDLGRGPDMTVRMVGHRSGSTLVVEDMTISEPIPGLPPNRFCRRCKGMLIAFEDEVCAVCISRGEAT
jgi:hypothetical protein